MKPLDLSLLFSSGAIDGPYTRGWWRALVDFLMAAEPDLSRTNKEIP